MHSGQIGWQNPFGHSLILKLFWTFWILLDIERLFIRSPNPTCNSQILKDWFQFLTFSVTEWPSQNALNDESNCQSPKWIFVSSVELTASLQQHLLLSCWKLYWFWHFLANFVTVFWSLIEHWLMLPLTLSWKSWTKMHRKQNFNEIAKNAFEICEIDFTKI